MSILGLILTYLLNKAEKPTYTNNYDKKRVNQESNEGRLLTDEVDDKASVAGAASRFAEERPPVGRRAVGAVAGGRQVDVVARVCQRVAEAEDARVAAEHRRAAASDDSQERQRPPRRQRCQRGGARAPRQQQAHGHGEEALASCE